MSSSEVVRILKQFNSVSSSSSQPQKEDFQNSIDNLNRETIVRAIPDVVHSNGASNLVCLLLERIASSKQHRNGLLLKVMQSILTELCDSEGIPENSAMDIVHILSSKCPDLEPNDLAKLVSYSLSFIQSGKNLKGKWLALFPMLFSELGKQNRILIDGQTMPGPEYCNEIIHSLCNTTVSKEDAVAFAALLRDLKITNIIASSRFIEKLCAIIPEMEPQEVPPLIYQLMFLCDQTDHLVPLKHLATYYREKLSRCTSTLNSNSSQSQQSLTLRYDSLETESSSDIIASGSSLKEILQSKATVIFHISRAAATGHPLGKKFLKFVKSGLDTPELVLMPFVLEVALSLGGLPSLRDMIDSVRDVIVRSLQSKEKQQHSALLREFMTGKAVDVQLLLNQLMQQCTCEADNICKGFELLGFSLLELRVPSVLGRPNPKASPVLQQLWSIGSQILIQIIKKFPDCAPPIVQKLVERLQDLSNDTQYINTISLMVQQNPLSMLDCRASFTALLYSMDYRGVSSARRLYAAVSPLLRLSAALRDTAFLVLRKLLHSCSEDARQVAVVGFLQVLKFFRFYAASSSSSGAASLSQTSMSSQATVDVHHNHTASVNRAFCNDLMKLLQCSLGQQSVVRLTLYQNFPEVVSRNPELLPECVKMLRNHLKFYADPGSGIRLEMCVTKDANSAHVTEPLGHLIQAIPQVILRSGMIVYLNKETLDAEGQVDQGVISLRNLTQNVAKLSTEDCVTACGGNVHESVEAYLKMQTFSSVCVALADFCLAHRAMTCKDWAKLLQRLHHMHAEFEKILKEPAKGAKGTGKAAKAKNKEDDLPGKTNKKPPPFDMCNLSLQNLTQFISVVLPHRPQSDDEEHEAIRFLKAQNNSLVRVWILKSALTKYQQLNLNGDVEGLSIESICKFSGIIGRTLLLNCQKAKRLPPASEPSTIMYCTSLEILYEIIRFMCKHQPTKLARLLTTWDSATSPDKNASVTLERHPQLDRTLTQLKELLNYLLSDYETELEWIPSAVQPVVGMLTVLSDQLEPSSDIYTQLREWVHKLCKDSICTDAIIAKALLTLLVHLSITSESSPQILVTVAKETHSAIGNLPSGNDESNRSTQPGKFNTINGDTASVALSILSTALLELLKTIESTLKRIGAQENGQSSPVVERTVYNRLNLFVQALVELIQTDVRSGPNSEQVFKVATAFYMTMSHVTKRQGKVIIPHFEKLIKNISTLLTRKVYKFIEYTSGVEKEEDDKKAEKQEEKKLTAKKRKRKDGEEVAPAAFKKPSQTKNARLIPSLFFAIETYSQNLLTVSKHTKTDLAFGVKLGTSRDFRIKMDRVLEEVDKDQPRSDQDQEEEEENRADKEPRAKRPRERARETRDEEEEEEVPRKAGAGKGRGRGRGRGKFLSAGKSTGRS